MASEQTIDPLISGGGRRRLLGDRRLARAAGGGDEQAFAELYRRHGPALYRYCASMLGEHDAADALQSAMTKALAALRRDGAPEEPRPWLYRIAHNESIDILRDRRSRAALDMAVEQASGAPIAVASPAEESEDKQRFRRLIADIHSLPERQRGALLMRELSGLSGGEIAAALGTSEATAKQAVYEARTALAEIEQGREMSCERVQKALSDGDRRVLRGRAIRAHIRTCERCQAFEAAIEERGRALNAFVPVLPALAAGTVLQHVVGGAAAGGGAAAAGAAAGTGGSIALGGVVAKVAVVSAATAAIGFGGYEGLRSAGVVGSGDPEPPAAEQAPPAGTDDEDSGGSDAERSAGGDSDAGDPDRDRGRGQAGSGRKADRAGGSHRGSSPGREGGAGSAGGRGAGPGSSPGEESRPTEPGDPDRGPGRPDPGEDRSNRGGSGSGSGGGSASNSNRGGAERGPDRAAGRGGGRSERSDPQQGSGRGDQRARGAESGRGSAEPERSKSERSSDTPERGEGQDRTGATAGNSA